MLCSVHEQSPRDKIHPLLVRAMPSLKHMLIYAEYPERFTSYHTPTNALVYNVFKIILKSSTLKHSYCSNMFRQHIACHPQGAFMILAKININMSIPVVWQHIMGWCVLCIQRVFPCAGRYVDWLDCSLRMTCNTLSKHVGAIRVF